MKLLIGALLVTGSLVNAGSVVPAEPDWTITAEPQGKIRANFDSVMTVRVVDEKKRPLDAASVQLVVTMVDMDHGEHVSPTKMTAPGVYEGKVNFFMVGTWMLEVRVKKGALAKSRKIRFDVKE